MASPNPVPPNFRVVDPSACEKDWNNFCLNLFCDSNPRIVDQNLYARFPIGLVKTLNLDDDVPLVGEFDGVIDEIHQHLSDSSGVADKMCGSVRTIVNDEFEALLMNARNEQTDHFLECDQEIEWDRVDVESSSLNLRKVQNVIDNAQKNIPG